MGYLFLINVIIILVQADDVIAIFYDVLALQFIQQLDDIGFGISKVRAKLYCIVVAFFFSIDFVLSD